MTCAKAGDEHCQLAAVAALGAHGHVRLGMYKGRSRARWSRWRSRGCGGRMRSVTMMRKEAEAAAALSPSPGGLG